MAIISKPNVSLCVFVCLCAVPTHGTSASQGENPTLLEVQLLTALNNNVIASHMFKVGRLVRALSLVLSLSSYF